MRHMRIMCSSFPQWHIPVCTHLSTYRMQIVCKIAWNRIISVNITKPQKLLQFCKNVFFFGTSILNVNLPMFGKIGWALVMGLCYDAIPIFEQSIKLVRLGFEGLNCMCGHPNVASQGKTNFVNSILSDKEWNPLSLEIPYPSHFN